MTPAKKLCLSLGKVFVLANVAGTYLCSFGIGHGLSMLPTFNGTEDVLVAEHVSNHVGKIVVGDVVLVRAPDDPTKMVIKRVLGLEGDMISYLRPVFQQAIVVPKGHVWIQGDNTSNSHDSRHYGPVPYGLIQGRVFFRVWPRDEFGFVK